MRILVAEDEKELLSVILKKLKEEGYGTDGCENGTDALYYLLHTEYDLAILDIMMPGKDGITVLKEIREKKMRLPVLFLTARDAVEDRVKGLDCGADDYLTKPFSFEELMARIRMLLRRNSEDKSDILKVADLSLELSKHRVCRGDREIILSAREFAILEFLMRNKGNVLTRSQLESHVWDYGFEGGSNIVDVYIRYLRKKIDQDFDTKLIHTVRGVGYRIGEKETLS